MEVIEHDGVVRQVIDAINAAFADGELPTVRKIKLTQEEMDEFMVTHPFTGNTGKFYGDDERGSLLEIETGAPITDTNGIQYRPVVSFRLKGILVYVGDR